MQSIPPTANQRLEEFVDLVELMRDAQRAYFESRQPSALNAAKAIERRVDLRCALYRAPKLPLDL